MCIHFEPFQSGQYLRVRQEPARVEGLFHALGRAHRLTRKCYTRLERLVRDRRGVIWFSSSVIEKKGSITLQPSWRQQQSLHIDEVLRGRKSHDLEKRKRENIEAFTVY